MLEQSNKPATFPYDETLFMIIEQISRKTGATVSFDAGLWGVEQVAAHLKRDRQEVVQDMVYQAGFPRAIRLPTKTGGKGEPLWKAHEVKDWAAANQ